jgi:hypothetical protein
MRLYLVHLKKESRILIIDKFNSFIIGLVIRGIAGIENSVVFKSCNELYNFLMKGVGIAGEVNYIILRSDICKEIQSDFKTKIITIDDIKDKELINEIKETFKIIHVLLLKYIIAKNSIL